MATLSVIRRWALREQMSIREIARRTGLSRNTVKKYLRAGEEMPRYAKRTSSSKLDPYAEKLATWLAIEATKSRKQRRNLRQIHTPASWMSPFSMRKRRSRQHPKTQDCGPISRSPICSLATWPPLTRRSTVHVRPSPTTRSLVRSGCSSGKSLQGACDDQQRPVKSIPGRCVRHRQTSKPGA